MTARNHPPRPPTRRPAVLAVALTATVFAVDLALPLGVAAAVPYTFAVLLALKAKSNNFAVGVAVACGVLTIAKMVILPERGTTELWKVIANRGLALFAIGMTTLLGVRRRQAEAERADAEEKVREHLADLARMGRATTAGQLATGLAHELNQPLAAIGLQAEVAEQWAANGADARELLPVLREIVGQSHRAAEIVRGLRRMLRREEPTPTPVDLGAVVRSVARLLDAQAHRTGVELVLALAPVPPVTGDRVQLEQVVFNLLQNAIESTAAVTTPPKAVTVATTADGPTRVTVTVRDTGVGLPADADRVFDRFFTTKPTGMGMGLAICRSIVETHGGKLWARPAPDRGAELAFSLPTVRG